MVTRCWTAGTTTPTRRLALASLILDAAEIRTTLSHSPNADNAVLNSSQYHLLYYVSISRLDNVVCRKISNWIYFRGKEDCLGKLFIGHIVFDISCSFYLSSTKNNKQERIIFCPESKVFGGDNSMPSLSTGMWLVFLLIHVRLVLQKPLFNWSAAYRSEWSDYPLWRYDPIDLSDNLLVPCWRHFGHFCKLVLCPFRLL